MLPIADLSRKIGQKLLFVGLESFNWSVADVTKAAQNARALGFDTLIMKAFDGQSRWYSHVSDLVAKRNACLAQGVGCVYYGYLYGPRFGAIQVQVEAAIAKEICDNTGNMVVLDMEAEWNGQEGSAALLASYLKAFTGDVIVTTFADPAEQNWVGVLKQLAPHVSAWMPQVYTTFLDNAEQEFKTDANIDLNKVFPVVDIADLFAGGSPVIALADAVKRGQDSFAVWEYGAMLSNINLVKTLLALLPKTGVNMSGPVVSQPVTSPVVTVAPHPTATNPITAPVTLPNAGTSPIRYAKYTIVDGDTLEKVAEKLHISNWYQDLFLPNRVTLNTVAKAHGQISSDNGNLIYSGTVLDYPVILA